MATGVFGRSRLERGASLVEMALVLPLLVMLLLGITTAGIAFNHQLSLTHASREAGRYGATLPVTNFGSMQSWLDAVAARVMDDAIGTLTPTSPGLFVCVAYVHPGGVHPSDQTMSRVNDGGTVTHTPGGTCFNDGRPNNERRVQVRVGRDADLNALVFQTTLSLRANAGSRFEAALG